MSKGIKTKATVKDVKALDKSAVAAERMKQAYIRTKDKAEHGMYAEESSPAEYASDRFSSGVDSVSHEAVHQFDKLEVDKLHTALAMLTPEEQALIQALFFEEKTERQYAEELGVYRNAIHVRKTKTLKKLKKLLE